MLLTKVWFGCIELRHGHGRKRPGFVAPWVFMGLIVKKKSIFFRYASKDDFFRCESKDDSLSPFVAHRKTVSFVANRTEAASLTNFVRCLVDGNALDE